MRHLIGRRWNGPVNPTEKKYKNLRQYILLPSDGVVPMIDYNRKSFIYKQPINIHDILLIKMYRSIGTKLSFD